MNEQCSGCRYAGVHYEPDETFTDGCLMCTCQAGSEVDCTPLQGLPNDVECDLDRREGSDLFCPSLLSLFCTFERRPQSEMHT